MSDYCAGCRFDVKETLGPTACPFNALYWNFLIRHDRLLRPNRRMGMIYGTLDRMAPARREAIVEQASAFLATLQS
jgi:deoxyribodipyrimidine photolyase-related protein